MCCYIHKNHRIIADSGKLGPAHVLVSVEVMLLSIMRTERVHTSQFHVDSETNTPIRNSTRMVNNFY